MTSSLRLAPILAFALATTPLLAQEKQEKPPAKKAVSAADIEALTKPGPEHEALAKYAGSWTIEVKMGGGKNAPVTQGTATSRTIVGGRFLQIDYETQSQSGGTSGTFILGYDSRHKRHTIIAMDNFGSYFVTSHGPKDEATGKIRMLGADDDPMMKAMGFTKEFVHLLDLRGPDEFAIEVFFIDTRTPARREMKAIDYTFKRQK